MADADPAKMHVWLSYVFNLEHMEKAVKPLWARVLDLAFINVSRDPYLCIFSLLRKVFIVRYPPQNDIFGTLRKHMKDAEHFLSDLSTAAFGAAAAKEAKEAAAKAGLVGLAEVTKKATTAPVAPKITAQRPKVIPDPMKICIESAAREVRDRHADAPPLPHR